MKLADVLLLVPTVMEQDLAMRHLPPGTDLRVCGFGPVAAAVETTRHLSLVKYKHVCLIGIAGTYDETKLPVGSACAFKSVASYGIGAGSDEGHQTASELGFGLDGPLPLHTSEPSAQDLLLTVTSAAASEADVGRRIEKFPAAVAEDMEGFAVALAADRCGATASVIRGISNRAGDRDHSRWQIEKALQAAVQLWLATTWPAGSK